MRTVARFTLAAAVGGVLAPAACRAVDGLDGLKFVDGGLGGSSCVIPGDVCQAPVPSGWDGPVAFFEGAPAAVPSCPSGYSKRVAEGQRDPVMLPAKCAPCECGAPSLTCTPGALTAHGKSGCHGSSSAIPVSAGACTTVSASGAQAFDMSDPTVTGTCDPSGGDASVPALTWTTAGIACALDGPSTTCTGSDLCAPAPPSPFEPRWCIWRPGSHTCPMPFPEQHQWESADDQRGCSACTCDLPAPLSCTVTVDLHSQPGCADGGTTTTISATGECMSATGVVSAQATATLLGTPKCAPDGGAPSGTVATTPVTTICCHP